MKLDFFKELNRRLVFLNKNERKKFFDKYDDIISCKMENGVSEEDAVSEFENTKLIAGEILDLYAVSGKSLSINDIKLINRMYPVIDIFIIFFAYMLTCYLYFKCDVLGISPNFPPFSLYMLVMVFVIPCYFLLYLLFGLYNINYIRSMSLGIRNLFLANITVFAVINVLLYLFSFTSFSRIFIVLFVLVNFILDIMMRMSLYLYASRPFFD